MNEPQSVYVTVHCWNPRHPLEVRRKSYSGNTMATRGKTDGLLVQVDVLGRRTVQPEVLQTYAEVEVRLDGKTVYTARKEVSRAR